MSISKRFNLNVSVEGDTVDLLEASTPIVNDQQLEQVPDDTEELQFMTEEVNKGFEALNDLNKLANILEKQEKNNVSLESYNDLAVIALNQVRTKLGIESENVESKTTSQKIKDFLKKLIEAIKKLFIKIKSFILDKSNFIKQKINKLRQKILTEEKEQKLPNKYKQTISSKTSNVHVLRIADGCKTDTFDSHFLKSKKIEETVKDTFEIFKEILDFRHSFIQDYKDENNLLHPKNHKNLEDIIPYFNEKNANFFKSIKGIEQKIPNDSLNEDEYGVQKNIGFLNVTHHFPKTESKSFSNVSFYVESNLSYKEVNIEYDTDETGGDILVILTKLDFYIEEVAKFVTKNSEHNAFEELNRLNSESETGESIAILNFLFKKSFTDTGSLISRFYNVIDSVINGLNFLYYNLREIMVENKL